jgi:hypothetical protein
VRLTARTIFLARQIDNFTNTYPDQFSTLAPQDCVEARPVPRIYQPRRANTPSAPRKSRQLLAMAAISTTFTQFSGTFAHS